MEKVASVIGLRVIKSKKKEFVVSVEMRDMDIVGKFQEFFACGTIAYRDSRQENHSPTHHWRVKKKKSIRSIEINDALSWITAHG
jgi:hypothetical protein